VLCAVATIGCSKAPVADHPPLHPASGRVTVNGKPVAGVVITLHGTAGPDAQKFVPAATSDADGSFRVGTFTPSDGAPEGEYAMTCVWPKSASADAGEVDQLRGRYAGAARSKLKVTIHPGDNQIPPLTLR